MGLVLCVIWHPFSRVMERMLWFSLDISSRPCFKISILLASPAMPIYNNGSQLDGSLRHLVLNMLSVCMGKNAPDSSYRHNSNRHNVLLWYTLEWLDLPSMDCKVPGCSPQMVRMCMVRMCREGARDISSNSL